MKHPMFKFIVAILLITACFWAFSQDKPELNGGKIVAHGECNFPPNHGYCAIVEKQGAQWVVLYDAKGQKAIYRVKPYATKKERILPEDVQLVWSRDSV